MQLNESFHLTTSISKYLNVTANIPRSFANFDPIV